MPFLLDILIGKDFLIAKNLTFSDEEFLCSPGSITKNRSCGKRFFCFSRNGNFFISVNCPVGTFFNLVSRDCVPCGAGSYQPREAQDTCLVCPAGKTNVEVGATNEDQCKGTAKS